MYILCMHRLDVEWASPSKVMIYRIYGTCEVHDQYFQNSYNFTCIPPGRSVMYDSMRMHISTTHRLHVELASPSEVMIHRIY